MARIDEKIIQTQNEIKNLEKELHTEDAVQQEIDTQSIYDDSITVYGVPIKFSQRMVLDNKVKIYMPTDFEQLSAEDISLIYPLGNKPQTVFGNSYFDFTLGFNYTEHMLPDNLMVEFSKVVKMILEKAGPKVKIFKQSSFNLKNTTVSTLEFTSHTLTDIVYNMMFFSSLEGRVLIGFINFNIKNLKRNKPIAKEIIKSFEFVKGE